MALITCIDCGVQHSDTAKACPICGRPVERFLSMRWNSAVTLSAAIAFLGLSLLMWLALSGVLK